MLVYDCKRERKFTCHYFNVYHNLQYYIYQKPERYIFVSPVWPIPCSVQNLQSNFSTKKKKKRSLEDLYFSLFFNGGQYSQGWTPVNLFNNNLFFFFFKKYFNYNLGFLPRRNVLLLIGSKKLFIVGHFQQQKCNLHLLTLLKNHFSYLSLKLVILVQGIFRRAKFFFVGRELVAARQMKCLILYGA